MRSSLKKGVNNVICELLQLVALAVIKELIKAKLDLILVLSELELRKTSDLISYIFEITTDHSVYQPVQAIRSFLLFSIFAH